MTVRLVKDSMTASLKKIQSNLDKLPEQAYEQWVKTTPKRTGNARRRTRLHGDTIHANYAYAEKLDSGSSTQAPDGMSKPVEKFIRSRLARTMRK